MYKVLIADDEIKVCRLIENVIDWEALGLTIIGIVNDGDVALTFIENYNPDIVITDIRMPGLNGLSLIERAKELNSDISFVIISGYRQFEYARQAMRFGVEDYLLKPLDENELTEILKKLISKKEAYEEALNREEYLNKQLAADVKRRQNNFMKSLITNEGKDIEVFERVKVNDEYCCNFQEGIFHAIIVKADIVERKENEEAYQILINQVQKLTENELRKDVIELLSYPSREGVYFLINMDAEYEQTLKERLRVVRSRISMLRDLFWDIKITACIGVTANSFEGIKKSIKSAKQAILNRLFWGLNHIIVVTDIKTTTMSVQDIVSSQFKNGIQERIEILDITKLHHLLDSIYQTVKISPKIDGELLFQVALDLIDTLFFSLRKINPEFQIEDKKDNFINRFYMCTSLEAVFKELTNTFDMEISAVTNLKAEIETKPIRIAKKYIQDNFSKPLKLDDISSMLGFNSSYFSGLFKKETGEKFSDYLSQVRINQAKQLLVQEILSVADIAEAVGYTDLKHFSKLFKRIAGINPTEFRKLYQRLS